MLVFNNLTKAMGARDHSKNRASSRKPMSGFVGILLAITCFAMFSCEEEPVIVESVTVSLPSALVVGNTLDLGASVTATISVEPPGAANKTATLASSNPAVVSVSETSSGWALTAEGAGQATITVTANDGGGASSSITVTVVVPPIALTVAAGTYVYNGAAQTPSVTVRIGNETLTENTDYTLAFSDNVNAGTATVTATGAGKYAGGSGTATFTIARFPISVTADDAEKHFWASDPTLTYTTDPALFGDDVLTGMLTRTGSNAIGTYDILQGNLAQAGNYQITDFTKGEFEIYYFRGEGTRDAPYEIDVLQQLAGLAQFVNAGNTAFNNKNYILTADIDLNFAPYNSGTGWTPIGLGSNPFRGAFDGNFRKVTGLFINNGSLTSAGLFGFINGGAVRNLGVEGSSISGGGYVGGLVGALQNNGLIYNCYTSIDVNGRLDGSYFYIGGVVGYVFADCLVSNCYSTGNVSGRGNVGGVVGAASTRCTVSRCYSIGIISGYSLVAGVNSTVGTGGTVEYCAALNPSIVRISGISGDFGRVTSSPVGTVGYTLTNNVAWDGMVLPPNNSRPAADITATAAKLLFSYEALGWRFGFNNDNPWKMGVGEYELPVFYWQTEAPAAMPEHLK